jgi:hypothetical protein
MVVSMGDSVHQAVTADSHDYNRIPETFAIVLPMTTTDNRRRLHEYNAKALVTFGSLTPDCQIRHLQRWIWHASRIASKPDWMTTCPTVLRYTPSAPL